MMSTTEGEVDIEVCTELEDGELEDSDVEDGTYIPLERPEAFNPPSLVNMQIQDEQSDEASAQESSGSESDEPRRRPKRTKLRPKRPQPTQPDKKEKYNVWCKALQEDLLTEDMVACDVTKKSRYGVESYDYTIKYRLDDNYVANKVFTNSSSYEDSDRTSNKRRHGDRSNIKLRLGQRVNSHGHAMEQRQEPKFLPDLATTADDPIESIAAEIAENLNEEKKDLVGKIVQVIGTSKAIELYKGTQRVEADGGFMVMNRTRRRTPGGVYFLLLKSDKDVPQEMINQIFTEDRKENARKIKRSRTKSRQKVMEQLKQSLTDSDLPALLSRGEATVQTEHGSNPPPSPVTDAKDCSSDTDAHVPSPPPADQSRRLQYDDQSQRLSVDSTDQSQREQPVPLDLDGQLQREQPPVDQSQHQRPLQAYDDDDFIEVMCNDEMDLF